jgi:DNA-binding PadR family transcriptional regulator
MIAKGLLRIWTLKLLSEGEKTGWQLMKELGQRTGWQPSPGTMYPLLKSLGSQGLLQRHPAGKRVYWRLTPEGSRYLEELHRRKREWLEELGIKERAIWQAFADPDHPLLLLPAIAHLAARAAAGGRGTEARRILEAARDRLLELAREDI